MADVRISARSTLSALNRWVEVISGNLVGSQITGFKGTRITFGDTLVDVIRGGRGATGNVGGINPVQIGTGGISVGGTTIDFKQGSLIQTGRNLDISIQGNSFFTIADSSGKIIYSRAGEFGFDDQGYLVTKEGNFVLGLYDRTREVINEDLLSDIGTGTGISVNFSTPTSSVIAGDNANAGVTGAVNFNTIFDVITNTGTVALQTVQQLLADPDVANRDRIVGDIFVPEGRLTVGTTADSVTALANTVTIGQINGTDIQFNLPSELNTVTRTSLDNAKALAKAINASSDATGVAASVVQNLNDQNQATLVLGHVTRVVAEASARMPVTPNAATTVDPSGDIRDTLTTNETGLVRTFKDNKNNLFYAINSLTLFSKAPEYRPEPGDVFFFDGTGALINGSKGKDAESAPPFNTGIHVALSKFANNQGLEKRRGGSQFTYTEATGGIVIGFAGLSKGSQINSDFGTEQNGTSTIGVENVIISQALESSNTSVTDALPELTVAQKTFTSNTKVVNVGNTIVDDLNGLIR